MTQANNEAKCFVVSKPRPVPSRPDPVPVQRTGDSQIRDRSKSIANPKEKPRPQERPTPCGPEAERIFQNEAGARLITKVLRELLAEQRFAEAGALREALEARCRDLRLAATREQFERALDLVGSNAQLLSAHRATPLRSVSVADAPAMKPHEAKAILDRLGVNVADGRVRRTAATTSRLVPL